MRYEKIVLILVIISIFSGCVTPQDRNINKKVNLDNLEIIALDYDIIKVIKGSDNVGRNILKINFKLTNIGTNKLEPYPDKFVIILNDGTQITEMLPIDEPIKYLNNKMDVGIKQGEDIFPGASYNIYKLFFVPINFDIKSTKIEVLSGERVEIFRQSI